MVPVGRLYGIWRDWLMRRAGPGRLSRLMWDSLALVSFQVQCRSTRPSSRSAELLEGDC